MITEKRLLAVAERPITSDGTVTGQITVADTADLKVGQIVILKSDTVDPANFQIKRVLGPSTLFLGDPAKPIQDRSDLTAYTTADNTTISAVEQKRPTVPEQEIERLTYEEEPTVARRVVQVDQYGQKYTTENPFPVQIPGDSISAQVKLTHLDDFPEIGDIADSVRVGDGTDLLEINPDGSINVVPLSASSQITVKNTYGEIASIASNTPTTIVSYTVPMGSDPIYLHKIFVSGTNMATYRVRLNGSIIDTKRTYFGSSIDACFDFSSDSSGLELVPTDIVLVEVEHARPFVGNFNARIQRIET